MDIIDRLFILEEQYHRHAMERIERLELLNRTALREYLSALPYLVIVAIDVLVLLAVYAWFFSAAERRVN